MKNKATCTGRDLLIVLLCVNADFDRRRDVKESSPLLILLVTSLIIALLIVVIFFLIRLQKAHLAWKKGNIRLLIYLYFNLQLYSRDLILNSNFHVNLLS